MDLTDETLCDLGVICWPATESVTALCRPLLSLGTSVVSAGELATAGDSLSELRGWALLCVVSLWATVSGEACGPSRCPAKSGEELVISDFSDNSSSGPKCACFSGFSDSSACAPAPLASTFFSGGGRDRKRCMLLKLRFLRRWGTGALSQKVSGTNKNSKNEQNATTMATIQKTQRQPMFWMMRALTSGTKFLPPRSSSV